MSYGPDIEILVRKAAIYVDRIIKGANPSDLPIEQPTRLQLVVNFKTASAQGLAIPPAVLARRRNHRLEAASCWLFGLRAAAVTLPIAAAVG